LHQTTTFPHENPHYPTGPVVNRREIGVRRQILTVDAATARWLKAQRMARSIRIEMEGGFYHVMARRNPTRQNAEKEAKASP
jgi:hypothetical protein